MALNTELTKAALMDAWDEVNALPGYSFSQRAFEKLALKAYHKAVLEQQRLDAYPVRIAAE
jgi:hypothetical protein